MKIDEARIHMETINDMKLSEIRRIVHEAELEKEEVGSEYKRECIDSHAYEEIRKMVLEEG